MADQQNTIISQFYRVLQERSENQPSPPGFGKLIDLHAQQMGISQRQLADALGVERKSLQRIIEGEAQKVDAVTLLKMGNFLGINRTELIDAYTASLEPATLRDIDRSRRAGFIWRSFDLGALKRAGFLDASRDFDSLEQRLLRFFGYNSLLEYEATRDLPLFSRTQRTFSSKMLRFWVNSAMQQIRLLKNPNPFDREALLKLITGLRSLTRDERNGLYRAARALHSVGVTVIVQRYLTGTQIRGATFVIEGRPAIVLTDFNQKYPSLWFALLHELYHVLKDMERIADLGYHLTGETDLFIEEMSEPEADEFAREFLLSSDRRRYIRSFIDIPQMVEEYAAKWGVHSSIVYAAHCWENGEWERYQHYLPKPDIALERLRISPWDKDSLAEAVRPLQDIYG